MPKIKKKKKYDIGLTRSVKKCVGAKSYECQTFGFAC